MNKLYPIGDGPSVPWEVMTPHEKQAQRNHGQTLERLAERGGLACSEAYCIVNDISWREMEKTIGYREATVRWIAFADRVNLHFDELDQLRARLEKSERAAAAVREALRCITACHLHPIEAYHSCSCGSILAHALSSDAGKGYVEASNLDPAIAFLSELREAMRSKYDCGEYVIRLEEELYRLTSLIGKEVAK